MSDQQGPLQERRDLYYRVTQHDPQTMRVLAESQTHEGFAELGRMVEHSSHLLHVLAVKEWIELNEDYGSWEIVHVVKPGQRQ